MSGRGGGGQEERRGGGPGDGPRDGPQQGPDTRAPGPRPAGGRPGRLTFEQVVAKDMHYSRLRLASLKARYEQRQKLLGAWLNLRGCGGGKAHVGNEGGFEIHAGPVARALNGRRRAVDIAAVLIGCSWHALQRNCSRRAKRWLCKQRSGWQPSWLHRSRLSLMKVRASML